MGVKDPRVDAYIANSGDFARPVLAHLRAVVHDACPEVEETMKWGFPHFMYHGILCHMAAFKAHCAFGFWKGGRVVGDAAPAAKDAMGQFGRITAVADLPSRAQLARHVKTAMRLNAEAAAAPARPRAPRRRADAPSSPDDLAAALRRNRAARATFEALSPSGQREYVEWITEAKRDETRQRRVRTAVEWLAEGKSRNWKYERR